MSQTYDGTFTTAQQNGAKQVTLPLQSEGNYHATLVRRNYIAAPATAYAPVLGTLTNYTQRLKYSDDFSNAVWTKAQTTATASAATDPEGQTTASKLAEDNTNNVHTATQAMTVASGAIAFGILVKAAERTFVRLRINNGTDGNLAIAVFNLSTGVVLSGTGTIKRLLNGWFWCSVQGTATVANSSAIIDLTSDGSTFTYLGTTGSGVYLWRATAYLAASIGPAVATTSTTRSVTAYPIDADDPLAFLVMEQEPDVSMLEMSVARWNREYANVPAQISYPTSIQITKPSMVGSFPQALGDYRVFQPDTTLLRFDAYYAQDVTNDTSTLNFYPTGGTYTLTFDGDTTAAIAYNASSATVQTELNALTSISDRGGVTVSGTYNSAGGFAITFASYATGSIDTSALLASGIPVTASSYTLGNSGYTQIVYAYKVGANVNGGTFTITIFGQTTAAIAYNATTATAAAALNALTEVQERGNCTVVAADGGSSVLYFEAFTGYNSVGFSIRFTNAVFTANSASLTPAVSTATPSITDSVGRTQKVVLSSDSAIRILDVPSHGLTTSDTLFIKGGSTYYGDISGNKFEFPDANTIKLNVAASDAYAAAGTITETGKRTKQSYSPGVANVRASRVTDYYLPGFTLGIASASDIPVPANQSDGTDFLLAVFAGTGSVNYAVGELAYYRCPILSVAKTTIQASDV
jgi:hypothetical protein